MIYIHIKVCMKPVLHKGTISNLIAGNMFVKVKWRNTNAVPLGSPQHRNNNLNGWRQEEGRYNFNSM